ncbi:MAG: phosphate signaling complex protein PhoU [Anaerolineales bacterium]|nr:phosphate signaling complex protein PhoU [Anaerolineales bacterium]
MSREIFQKNIQDLIDEVLLLGSMVETATTSSVKALQNRDIEASRQIYRADQAINDKRFEIEEKTLVLIATQSPMARDLRILASILEIITELERMGDYAKGIAKININLGEERLLKPLIDLPKMSDLTVAMLHKALKAFADGDEKTANKLVKDDDAVDELYIKINRELLQFMINDSETIDRANQLMWAAHNLERMADRVINICERTIFINSGKLLELSFSDDEDL